MPRVLPEVRRAVGEGLVERYGSGPVPGRVVRTLAAVHGVSERTVREWRRRALEGWPDLGRPPVHDALDRWRALRAVRRMLRECGWSLGEPRARLLLPGIPRSLLRWALRLWKPRGRSRERDRRRRLRRSMEASHRDGAWVLDATELARDEAGEKVHGIVVRDVATTRVRAASVTGQVTARDVLALLLLAWRRTGRLPLVLLTDNGSQMVAEVIRRFLSCMRIVHVCNLPHTPEHNAFAERTIRDLKEESGLDGRTPVRNLEEAAAGLGEAIERIERSWPRMSRGGKTALALDRTLPVAENHIDRTALFEAACSAASAAARNAEDGRARRRKVREAYLDTLEAFDVITRTGGDGGK
jgi:transposase InsO family protein